MKVKPHIVKRFGTWRVRRKGTNYTWKLDAMIWRADRNEQERHP